MTNRFIQNIKRTPKRVFIYSALAVILAILTLIVLNYFEFYVHELGHANSALLDTVTTKTNSITINFTYKDYILFGKDSGLKYPQQTFANIHTNFRPLFSLSGVLFSIIFYGLIFSLVGYILTKIKRLKDNNRIALALVGVFVFIIINDIISNLFCGTDGLNLSCSNSFLMTISGIFLIIELFFLGFFYVELFMLKKDFFKKRNLEVITE